MFRSPDRAAPHASASLRARGRDIKQPGSEIVDAAKGRGQRRGSLTAAAKTGYHFSPSPHPNLRCRSTNQRVAVRSQHQRVDTAIMRPKPVCGSVARAVRGQVQLQGGFGHKEGNRRQSFGGVSPVSFRPRHRTDVGDRNAPRARSCREAKPPSQKTIARQSQDRRHVRTIDRRPPRQITAPSAVYQEMLSCCCTPVQTTASLPDKSLPAS